MFGSRELSYLLFLPEDYEADAARQWPLILFLHGAGERGDDLERVRKNGLPKVTGSDPHFPFVVVSPQCPAGTYWPYLVDDLNDLVESILAQYRVDGSRVYLTGISMGGYGTFYLAMAYPSAFAALAPICGGGDPTQVGRIRHLPTWVFHGARDNVVPLEESELMVSALRKAGANVQFTVYPHAGHDAWTETYNNPQLYDWFLCHQNKETRR
ncbi:MAG: prolyl oligopeptidase family serine peptidase [Cytophagales bacterium]|nr:prolyl oligopeptidase family serine peptidase [Cytophagales bacterium]